MMTKEIEEGEKSKTAYGLDLVTKILFLASCLLLGANIVNVFSLPEGVTEYNDGLSNSNSENTSRNLTLYVHVDIDETFLENLYNEGYFFTLQVKGDQYVDQLSYPIGVLLESDIINIPIVNNATNHDDGEQDLKIDVWVNNYDDKSKTVDFNEGKTVGEIDLTESVEYVIADTNKEADESHE